jgi:hypothetical protein
MFSSNYNPGGDHMYPFYLIIKRHQPCKSMSSYFLFSPCLLPSLLLNPSCASNIGTHVPTWIYSQACLKVLVKSITDLVDIYWSPSCSKLCSNTFFNNFDNYFICYNLQLCYSFGSFILLFIIYHLFFLFLISSTTILSMVFFLRIFRYSIEVTKCD